MRVINISKMLKPYSDDSLSDKSKIDEIKGPSDMLLASDLSMAHRHARRKARRIGHIQLGFALVLMLASLPLAFGALWIEAYLILAVAFVVGIMGASMMRRAFLQQVAEGIARGFYRQYPKKDLTHIHGYRLLFKLGMSSTFYPQQSEVITSAIYLGRHEENNDFAILAYSHFPRESGYVSLAQTIQNFVESSFFGKKAHWRHLLERDGMLHPELIPHVNSYIRDSFACHLMPALHETIKPYLEKDSELLRLILKRQPDILDSLGDVTDEQLGAWCELHLPCNLRRKPLFGKRRLYRDLALVLPVLMNERFRVPAALMMRLADYCVGADKKPFIEDFARWLWCLTPKVSSPPKSYAQHNAWMLKAAAKDDLATQRSRLFVDGSLLNSAILYAYRKIIGTEGVDQAAMSDEICHLGYKNLFGLEAALKAFPGAGRTLLSNDLGL